MAVPLDEQIMDRIVTQLATITTGNGYEQTVLAANIHRDDGISPEEVAVAECPGLVVRKLPGDYKPHLRGALEMEFDVQVICVVDAGAADPQEARSDLMNDVIKLVEANKTWNSLARRTRLVEAARHETETREKTLTGSVLFRVLARADLKNPFVTKTI